jgi:hypothetical protein
MNPIIEQLHILLLRLQRSHPAINLSESDWITMLDPIHNQMTIIYEHYCNTILRNYYGTMYETIFDQHRHSLNAQWVHSLQERMKENYCRNVRQVLLPLDEYYDAYEDAFSKIQSPPQRHEQQQQQHRPNILDVDTLVNHFMSDLQDMTELHMDVSDMGYNSEDDNNNEGGLLLWNDITNPTQYRNRLRRQKIYRYSKNVLKRLILMGVNYIQGYIAIQSIRHLALQQEREMPKFPLF